MSELLVKFIKSVSIINQSTAKQYYSCLLFFQRFAQDNCKVNSDELILKLKHREYDTYDILNEYCYFFED